MKNKRMFISVLFVMLFVLASCKVINQVTDNLELSGYDVTPSTTFVSTDYTVYEVHEGLTLVAYIYEFPSFRKARDYYEAEELDQDTMMTWVIHNQLLIAAYDEEVIHVIVD